MDDELTTTEAALYLGVTPQRVYELAQTGKVTRRRKGSFWLYPKADLDRWRTAPKSKGGRPKAGARARAPGGTPPATGAHPSAGVDPAAPPPRPAAPPPAPLAQVRAVVLASNEPDHWTADGRDTLCGRRIPGGAYWRPQLDRRRACQECRRSAAARGLGLA